MRIEIKPSFVETSYDFLRFIEMFGGGFFKWYVGLTTDTKRSFLEIHRVDMLEKQWIISNECPVYKAIFIKRFLLSMGCVNTPELDLYEVEKNNLYVYLYRMKE
ncbi:MAG: hypothetical protein GY714_22205 [Desulfobacterales bacterium]|nr:hypothetical protein [Desulfobacterales bacterium]